MNAARSDSDRSANAHFIGLADLVGDLVGPDALAGGVEYLRTPWSGMFVMRPAAVPALPSCHGGRCASDRKRWAEPGHFRAATPPSLPATRTAGRSFTRLANDAAVAHSTKPSHDLAMSPRQHLGDGAAHRVADDNGRAHRQLVYEGGQVVRATLDRERGAPQPSRPWPRRSGATARKERPRNSSDPYQLSAAVAIQPWSSSTAGAPRGSLHLPGPGGHARLPGETTPPCG